MEILMRLAFVPLTIMTALGPAMTARAADLDGPLYEERDRVVIERPAPRVIERERIIEHHYYERRPEVYVAPPRAYAPKAYAPYSYAYDGDYRVYGYGPGPFWHRHRGW
jgi:hypothetical protein